MNWGGMGLVKTQWMKKEVEFMRKRRITNDCVRACVDGRKRREHIEKIITGTFSSTVTVCKSGRPVTATTPRPARYSEWTSVVLFAGGGGSGRTVDKRKSISSFLYC